MKCVIYGLVYLFLVCSNSVSAQPGSIKVYLNSLRSTKGVCIVSLFHSSRGFPFKNSRGKTKIIRMDSQLASVVFDKIPAGTYAISVFHDENEDGKLNTDFWGNHKEGSGVSRNISYGYSFPKFREVNFPIDTASLNVSIQIKYNWMNLSVEISPLPRIYTTTPRRF